MKSLKKNRRINSFNRTKNISSSSKTQLNLSNNKNNNGKTLLFFCLLLYVYIFLCCLRAFFSLLFQCYSSRQDDLSKYVTKALLYDPNIKAKCVFFTLTISFPFLYIQFQHTPKKNFVFPTIRGLKESLLPK